MNDIKQRINNLINALRWPRQAPPTPQPKEIAPMTPPEPTAPPPIEFTHEQYMAKECTHDQFWGQFVTRSTRMLVLNRIGEPRILRSTNPHFNDIPLREWDMLKDAVLMGIDKKKFMRLTWPNFSEPGKVYWSLSDAVCIAKQVARMVREENQGETK